ncbi:biliverdin-producing heme oxygenase [uncultured Paracoccus sp.]|uniref:biliverdin-producing heme oxygenase n=1 Tax=uncultured Paracoccus sp. TaxID=189685 RepID=UPI0025EB72A6|nr:biliverdin-producing heme oxygenase [uncultured Paracoccus sp.]
MAKDSLRRVLMTETRDLHDGLDDAIGSFADPASYRAFLSGSYAFRAAVEPALSGADWQVQPLASLIAQDLADLDLPRPALPDAPVLDSRAAQAAACYVLEGSALGARLLARRAAQQGFTPDHGARHLAAQTASPQRWRQFLDWLEDADLSAAQAVTAARDVFGLAQRAYGVEASA